MPVVLIGGQTAADKRDQLAEALRGAGLTVALTNLPFDEDRWPFAQDAVFVLVHTRDENPDDPDDPMNTCAARVLEHKGPVMHVLFHKMTVGGPLADAPSIDLIQWRGSADNLYIKELVAKLRTAQDEATKRAAVRASPPGWIMALWQRYKVSAAITAVLVFIVLSFFNNLINAETACSINFAQPTLSDICGYWGLGDKPKRQERLDWARVDRTDCEALQAHARAYPSGAHRAEAIDLFNAGKIEERISWHPTTRETPLFEAEPETGSASAAEGLAELLERVEIKAVRQCAGYAVGGSHRVISASARADATPCEAGSGGFFCSFDGVVICELEWREVRQVRVCGGP